MRLFVAFIISLFIYALLLWLLVSQFSNIETPPKRFNDHVIKIDIKDIPLPIKSNPAKSKPKVVNNSTPKVVKKKTVPKKKPVKKKVIVKKRPTKTKPKKKVVVKKKPKLVKKDSSEMIYIPNPIRTPKKSSSSDLSSFLSTPSSSNNSYPNRKIQKLYGSAFHSFTPTQKKFIEDNLNIIQQITQRTLTRRGYPEGAGVTGQEGTNVVSFNLHPNGDISNLRLKTRTGYRALDENTITLIRVAYKDYPYPKTTTKIIFYVHYSIYGY